MPQLESYFVLVGILFCLAYFLKSIVDEKNKYFETSNRHHPVCRRFEFGAAIFIAWGGSLLDVLGGAMLAASCPRKKQVSKYPSMASSRSGPPSSTKEYVWERHLQFGMSIKTRRWTWSWES